MMTKEERAAKIKAGRERAEEERRLLKMAQVREQMNVQKEEKQVRKADERQQMVRERKKWSGFHAKLDYKVPEGYFGYWCNDDRPGKILDLEERGFEFMMENGVKVARQVGVLETGKPLTAYLMIQKLEWHEEDEKERAKLADEVDASILAGSIAGKGENSYGNTTMKRN